MRRPRLSASSSGSGPRAGRRHAHTPFRLSFDYSVPYQGTDVDFRPFPRLPVYVSGPGTGAPPARAVPVLDSGADYSAFDGTTLRQLGWREEDIIQLAEETHPVSGISAGERLLVGYIHRLTCLIPLGHQYASVQLRALVTPPNSLSTPVLGRRDFLRQVDFALIEAEQRFCLRFRDRSVLHDSWE